MSNHIRKPATLITGANGEMGHGLITRLAAEGTRPILTLDLKPLEPALARLVAREFTGSVLDRSVLLNTLIRRKAISWTKIFSDLGTVCPPTVRVIAIRPTINSQGGLFLDMQVASDSPEPVIAFIAKLEGSDVFGSTAVSGFTPPSQTNPFYRYQLSVNYAQKL